MSEDQTVYGGGKFCGNCGIRVDGLCTLTRAEQEHCMVTPGRPYWRKLATDREKLEEFLEAGKVVAKCIEKPDTIKKNNHDVDPDEMLRKGIKHMEKKFEQWQDEAVNHPRHYTSHPREVIDVIRDQLLAVYGLDGFRAYCWGNEIKYRMRAGLKGEASEDIGKAMKYKEFREAIDEH